MYQPLFTRILKEDLGKDAPPWTDKLTYQINLMADYLKTAFAKNITIQDNLMNPIKSLQLTARASPDLNTISFLVTLPSGYQPKGVQVVNCIDLSGVIVGNAVWAEMQPGLQNGNVVIRAVYGLTDTHTYSLTFLVY
jgi:hypothetical protein